jgi:hypothetical protein
MSPLFKKRPPVTVHKFFCRKVLRHFYVPFVGSTEAPSNQSASACRTDARNNRSQAKRDEVVQSRGVPTPLSKRHPAFMGLTRAGGDREWLSRYAG